MSDIKDHQPYKESLTNLDEAIRFHLAVVEQYGNDTDSNGTGVEDKSVLTGWVLVMNTLGYNEDGEFQDGIAEMSEGLNHFTALGLSSYLHSFMKNTVDDYSYED